MKKICILFIIAKVFAILLVKKSPSMKNLSSMKRVEKKLWVDAPKLNDFFKHIFSGYKLNLFFPRKKTVFLFTFY